ncbi:MAG: hypothetical protein PHQ28_00945 [Mycobacterium sp.]|nr:hypothetical protein [Mycobacterium sp.]
MDAAADISFDEYRTPPPPNASAHDIAAAKRLQRLIASFEDAAAVMRAEAQACRTAELFWISREMVDIILQAAESLPEWTPAAALPVANGMLCWAKSAGTVPAGVPLPETVDATLNNPGYIARQVSPDVAAVVDLPWDGVWWWTRPDGLLQLTPFSRAEQKPEVLRLAGTTSPVWAAQTIMVRPDIPRTEETAGDPRAQPFVSAVGAAWLLMAEASLAETRTIGPDPETQPPDGDDDRLLDRSAPARRPSPVTIVDLRARPAAAAPAGGGGNRFNHRFLVSGHWRQQAYGPNRSWRKPKFIGSYIKGPKGSPLIAPKTRVHVLRKER